MKATLLTPAPLRRVGAGEGALHIGIAAALFAALAQPLEGGWAVLVTLAMGGFWTGCYVVFRYARLRDWFGAWDTVSFATVASYAVVLGLAAVGALNRWV